MFREMRRKNQKLTPEECDTILYRGSSGVLALSGDDDYPYAVPLSYVYDGEKLYFHCAQSGHKLDAIRRNQKASFCVIDKDQIVPEIYTTYFQSVIVFGTMRILENEQEIQNSIEKLAVKYSPDSSEEHRQEEINRFRNHLCMLEMTPAHISGKLAKDLIQKFV